MELKKDTGREFKAYYNTKNKNIRLCNGSYGYYNKETQKVIVIGLLIHELRHSYQHKMKVKIFNKSTGKNYHPKNSLVEIDAYEFTSRFLLHNRIKLNNILKIHNNKWTLSKEGQLTM